MFFKFPHSYVLYYCTLTIFCLSLISCESKNQKTIKRTQFTMGTLVEIIVHESNEKLAQNAINKSFNEISRLEKIMSTYLSNSELSKFNKLAKNKSSIPVSHDLLKVIKRGVYWGKLSNGAIDISIGPAVKLWDFNSEKPTLPSIDKIRNATNYINYENIIVDKNSVNLKKLGMSLHLGSIGKGYAVDQAINILKNEGIKSGLVNAGGDLVTFGLKSNNKPWSIGIQHPRKPEKIILSLDIKDKAMATSGDYQKYFMENKVRHHHILDPKSGWPQSHTMSATVIAETAMDADALSTALFILGDAKGISLINSIKGVEGMIISSKGSASYSSGFINLPGLSLEKLKETILKNKN